MAGATDLAGMVPGFEFLQSLMKGAGSALPGMPGIGTIPGMSQWIAPTLDPVEIDKRIQELKTVQFWLEQNARLLATTIQALEVQRMTLSTLQTMNLPMADLRDALKIKLPAGFGKSSRAARDAEPEPEADPEVRDEAPSVAPRRKTGEGVGKAAPAAIDPMQWWNALTQQFTELATRAVKDGAAGAATGLAGAAVKQTMAAAGSTLKKAARLPEQTAAKAPHRTGAARKRRA